MNLRSQAKRDAKESLVTQLRRAKREAKGVIVNLKAPAQREAKESWSSYLLGRNERQKGSAKLTSSRKPKAKGSLSILDRAKVGSKGSCLNNTFEQSERLRGLG